mmetsp:Transcript_25612/g.45487  ORF Transcript_25612/g.45487 Transcript_25612/m.45487 type:complete len:261 (-) Transcript_25612:183-965(-)
MTRMLMASSPPSYRLIPAISTLNFAFPNHPLERLDDLAVGEADAFVAGHELEHVFDVRQRNRLEIEDYSHDVRLDDLRLRLAVAAQSVVVLSSLVRRQRNGHVVVFLSRQLLQRAVAEDSILGLDLFDHLFLQPKRDCRPRHVRVAAHAVRDVAERQVCGVLELSQASRLHGTHLHVQLAVLQLDFDVHSAERRNEVEHARSLEVGVLLRVRSGQSLDLFGQVEFVLVDVGPELFGDDAGLEELVCVFDGCGRWWRGCCC